jgi:hypothetical protein
MSGTITNFGFNFNAGQFGDGDWDIGQPGSEQPITGSMLGTGVVNNAPITVTLLASDGTSFQFVSNISSVDFTSVPPGTSVPWAIPMTLAEGFLDGLSAGTTVDVQVEVPSPPASPGSLFSLSEGLPITCFAAGTLIATARGEVPIEALRVGDLVVTMHGGTRLRPIVWIGHTRVDIARQTDRSKAAPILIRAGALADGVPHRDLRVSPEHAMFLDGYLVPARLLVNGTSIVQETWCNAVTYWHVELESHGLLVSEGAVSESYFDDGNRQNFDNHAITALVKDFESHRANGHYRQAACAPVLDHGSALERVRLRLAMRVNHGPDVAPAGVARPAAVLRHAG